MPSAIRIWGVGAVPFEHGELGVVQRPALAVAPDVAEAGDAGLAGGQELLHGEFGRGVEIEPVACPVIADGGGREGVEMGLVAGRELQAGRVDEQEALGRQPGAERQLNAVADQQQRPAVGVPGGGPPGRDCGRWRGTGQRRGTLGAGS
jgi:hypothetical protein